MKVIYIFDGKVIEQQEGAFISSTPLPGEHVSFADGEHYTVDFRDWSFAPSDGISYPTVITIYLSQ